jgi:hypothetical protein
MVLDHTGSVGENWPKVIDFTANFIDNFAVSEQGFKVGVISYGGMGGCNPSLDPTVTLAVLSANKTEIIEKVSADRQVAPPCASESGNCLTGLGCNTATVKGISRAFDQFLTDGRIATDKAVIVFTDGIGNRPTASVTGGLDCSGADWMTASTSGGNSANHDTWLCFMYTCRLNESNPTMYSIGVSGEATSDIDLKTLNLIAQNSGGSCPIDFTVAPNYDDGATHERAIFLDSFDSLGTVTYDLAEQLLCPNPGATPCPDDCRPGGFCCAGTCICIENCLVNYPGDSCQSGACATTASGTQCVAIGSRCSSSNDPTGIIVGSVLGALAACICLLGLLALAAVLVALFYRKSVKDVKAWEDAFANDNNVSSSPLFVEKNESVTSALYDGGD